MNKNNLRFNELLNSCINPMRVYNALLIFAEPSIKQTDDVGEKRQIIIGELLPLLNETQSNQQLV